MSGSRKRRRPRSVGGDTPSTKTASIARLDITVAALSTGDSLDFSRELALTKAAVLYGDRVTLVGPKVTLVSYVERLRSGTRDERDRLFLRMLRALPQGDEALRRMDVLAAEGPAQRRAVTRLKGQLLTRARSEIDDALEPILQQTQYEEFSRAIRSGIVELDPLTPDGRRP